MTGAGHPTDPPAPETERAADRSLCTWARGQRPRQHETRSATSAPLIATLAA